HRPPLTPLDPAAPRKFPRYHGRVKRTLAGLLLLAMTGAAVYGFTLSETERAYRQLIADGDAAIGREDSASAIEAFSWAITLKPDSMLGYLKRGQTYRRRGD